MSAGVHADLAADSGGNFVFPDLHPVNDGLLAVGKLLELLARQKMRLSDVVTGLPAFFMSSGNVPGFWETKSRVMGCLMQQFSKLEHETIDGIKISLNATNGCSSGPMKRPRRFTSLRRPAPSRMRSNSSPIMAVWSRRLSRSRVPIHRSRKASIASFPACPTRVAHGLTSSVKDKFNNGRYPENTTICFVHPHIREAHFI